MIWCNKVLAENKKEIITSAIISIVITLAFSVWYFITGKGFEWKTINPIEQPSLLNRYFYSAFVFSTIGAFLYYVVKLWKGLYFIFVKMLRSRELYELIKWALWTSLILLTYFYIMPVIVKILNAVISFFYNITILLAYLSPPIGIFLIVFLSGYGIYMAIKGKLTLPKIK
jgi:hypothetical protein